MSSIINYPPHNLSAFIMTFLCNLSYNPFFILSYHDLRTLVVTSFFFYPIYFLCAQNLVGSRLLLYYSSLFPPSHHPITRHTFSSTPSSFYSPFPSFLADTKLLSCPLQFSPTPPCIASCSIRVGCLFSHNFSSVKPSPYRRCIV